ncbi:helix-turn-helix domain-containing protein [Taibaiella helva]|uniref:helix-turn-helix domain-containing protein n=1 Tax=Taibaiella helva TaxID=2301235 RepID=UPI000E58CA7B|nr:AraC family transcriptional regulator [Taibaiella helva]
MVSKEEKRSKQITRQYFSFLDRHIDEVIDGTAPVFLELNQIARELAVSHKHLTDTVQKETGHHPCHFYDEKIIDRAKALLARSPLSIAQIALTLTYDPSNFSKFFRKWTGMTPGSYRDSCGKAPRL